MASSLASSVITRLISMCITLPDSQQDVAFEVMMKYDNPESVLKHFVLLLKRSREPPIKIKISSLACKFIGLKGDFAGHLNKDFFKELILALTNETPASIPIKQFGPFIDAIRKLSSQLGDRRSQLVDELKSGKDGLQMIGLAITSQEPLSYFIDQLQSCRIQDVVAATVSINDKSIKESHLPAIQSVLDKTFTMSKAHRKASIKLVRKILISLPKKTAASFSLSLFPLLTSQFKEKSTSLKREVVKCLSCIPLVQPLDASTILNAILPPLATKLGDVTSSLTQISFEFLEPFKNEETLASITHNLIASKDTFSIGIAIACRFNLFTISPTLIEKCFPDKPSAREALAAAHGISVLKNPSRDIIGPAVKTVIATLSSPSLLDDLVVLHATFDSLDSLASVAISEPAEFFSALVTHLHRLNEDDVLARIGSMVQKVFSGAKNWEPNPSDPSKFSVTFLPIISRLSRFPNDEVYRQQLLYILTAISSCANKKIIECPKPTASLVTIVDALVPITMVDSLRSDAVYQMQHNPHLSLIAVALQGSDAFLPTLTRVAKSLSKSDPVFIRQFLRTALERCFESFSPYLLRFLEPPESSTKLFSRAKPQPSIPDIWDCIGYAASNLELNSDRYSSLLEIVTAILSVADFFPETLSTIQNLAVIQTDIPWPKTLVTSIVSQGQYKPVLPYVLRRTNPDPTLALLAARTYVNGQSNYIDPLTVAEAIMADVSRDILSAIFSGLSDEMNGRNPMASLSLAVASVKTYLRTHDTASVVATPPILLSALKCSLSHSLEIRTMAKNLVLYLSDSEPLPSSDISQSPSSDRSSPHRLAVPDPSPTESDLEPLISSISRCFGSRGISSIASQAVSYHHASWEDAAVFSSLVSSDPAGIMSNGKAIVSMIAELNDIQGLATKQLLVSASIKLAQANPSVFLYSLLSKPVTNLSAEILTELSKREGFLEEYATAISQVRLPQGLKEVSDLLTTGIFQGLRYFTKGKIGPLISVSLTWLAMIYAARGIKINHKAILAQLNECVESALGYHKCPPYGFIEFSVNSPHALFESLGTLAQGISGLGKNKIGEVGNVCFNLSRGGFAPVCLVGSLFLARLTHRVGDSGDLGKQLRIALARGFAANCDENARVIASAVGGLFGNELFEGAGDDDLEKWLIGSIRAVACPGDDLKNEAVGFLCRIVHSLPKHIVAEHTESIWSCLSSLVEIEKGNPKVLDTLAILITIDESGQKKFNESKLSLVKLVYTAVTDSGSLGTASKSLVMSLMKAQSWQEAVHQLPEGIGTQIYDKIGRTGVSSDSLNLMKSLVEYDDSLIERYVSVLLSIIEDAASPLREVAYQSLLDVINQKAFYSSYIPK